MADRKDPLAGTPHADQAPPQYGGSSAPNTQSYYNADAIVPQQTGTSELPGSPGPHPHHSNSYTSHTPAQDAGAYYAGQQPMSSPQHTGASYQSHSPPPQNTQYAQPPGQSYEMHQQQSQPYQEHYGQAQKPGYQQPQQPPMAHQPAGAAPVSQPPGYEKYRNATPLGNLGSSAAPVDCPNCRQRAMTSTRLESGGTTNAWAALLCLVFCLGCIPYCVSGSKDVVHTCSNCEANLATWHRSGRTEVHMHG